MNEQTAGRQVDFKDDKIIVSEFGYPTYTFRLVDSVPPGHMIWNIGKLHMPEDYLPLCKLSFFQPYPGGRSIDVETLLAIKTNGAHIILDAIGYGPHTPDEMEKYIEKHKAAKPGSCRYEEVKRMKAALPYMRKIRWSAYSNRKQRP